MCESCGSGGFDRRTFLAAGSALGATGLLSTVLADEGVPAAMPPREKQPPRVQVVFLYPPADVVIEGRMEDSWRVHNWFTWPGNQFEPEAQQHRYTEKIKEMGSRLGMTIEFAPKAIYQEAEAAALIEAAKASKPDAVLVVNFWNTLSKMSLRIATEAAPTAVVYHSVGSNHQLPPADLRKQDGFYYIHSIDNFDEIERGLRAVRAKKMLAQSRLLRIGPGAAATIVEPQLGVEIVCASPDEYNAIFDAIEPDDELRREAMEFKKHAARVMDVTDEYFVEAMRAHRTVGQIMQRYGADAITIACLLLQHRKPCVSFALNNGELIPCGCENHLDGTLTQMLGRWLFDRAGFMHNPEFDTSENRYFGAHCTCALKLHGPQGKQQPYLVRPFFHQLPKTAALDVQWTPDEPVLIAKYLTGQDALACWTGRIVESPTSPPTGGCATRVLIDVDRVDDVCDIYSGTHPILFCGSRGDARRLKAFATMYRLKLVGNV
jgi:hypothetical protein